MVKQICGSLSKRGNICLYQGKQYVAIRDCFTTPHDSPEDWRVVEILDDPSILPSDGKDGVSPPPAKDGKDAEPSIVWRGLYSRRVSYSKGDAVSWNGSSFIANRDTTHEPAPGSTHWDILSKAGSDGKAGKNETYYVKHGSPRLVSAMSEIESLRQKFEPQQAVASSPVSKNDVLYLLPDGTAAAAAATNADLPCGVAVHSSPAGQQVKYIPFGLVESDWILEPGKIYYLSATTPGAISATSPGTDGTYNIVCGLALTESLLRFDPERTIRL